MLIESPEDIEKFLGVEKLINNKSEEKSKETTESSKVCANLFNFLMGRTKKEQSSLLPQGIPLRSKYSDGTSIPNTSKNYKKWRKLIFDTQGNFKNFHLINKNGKQYVSKINYIKCSKETAFHVINNEWHSAYETQSTLIKQIKKNPSQFEYSIIIKNTNNGNSFLMLHCQPKKD